MILSEIQKQEPWPCFADHPDSSIATLGTKGIRDLSFHQKQARMSPTRYISSQRASLKHEDKETASVEDVTACQPIENSSREGMRAKKEKHPEFGDFEADDDLLQVLLDSGFDSPLDLPPTVSSEWCSDDTFLTAFECFPELDQPEYFDFV